MAAMAALELNKHASSLSAGRRQRTADQAGLLSKAQSCDCGHCRQPYKSLVRRPIRSVHPLQVSASMTRRGRSWNEAPARYCRAWTASFLWQ